MRKTTNFCQELCAEQKGLELIATGGDSDMAGLEQAWRAGRGRCLLGLEEWAWDVWDGYLSKCLGPTRPEADGGMKGRGA